MNLYNHDLYNRMHFWWRNWDLPFRMHLYKPRILIVIAHNRFETKAYLPKLIIQTGFSWPVGLLVMSSSVRICMTCEEWFFRMILDSMMDSILEILQSSDVTNQWCKSFDAWGGAGWIHFSQFNKIQFYFFSLLWFKKKNNLIVILLVKVLFILVQYWWWIGSSWRLTNDETVGWFWAGRQGEK